MGRRLLPACCLDCLQCKASSVSQAIRESHSFSTRSDPMQSNFLSGLAQYFSISVHLHTFVKVCANYGARPRLHGNVERVPAPHHGVALLPRQSHDLLEEMHLKSKVACCIEQYMWGAQHCLQTPWPQSSAAPTTAPILGHHEAALRQIVKHAHRLLARWQQSRGLPGMRKLSM